ncbi:hypothetical protein B0H13DRAFT_2315387 [Mycena leptocephala]|nr:hypothetical protein B0H13DRAFT_2315387 [Mycena leptocephala]
MIQKVSPNYPCGFCGKTTSTGRCTISIRGGKAVSTCTEVYEFQIAAASKSSAAKPYNMAAHLRDSHPNWELTATPETRQVVLSKAAITHS